MLLIINPDTLEQYQIEKTKVYLLKDSKCFGDDFKH